MKFILAFLTITFSLSASFTELHSHAVDTKIDRYVWTLDDVKHFDELLLSWNGKRPEKGKWTFYVSVKDRSWSPWLKYAEWESEGQTTFSSLYEFVEIYQDTVSVKEGKGFAVKVLCNEGTLENLDHLYVCLSNGKEFEKGTPTESLEKVEISGISGRSQMILDHPQARDLCSPTSTSTVVNFLAGKEAITPINFANRIHDDGFDIYGCWPLNTAEASSILNDYACHIERLENFSALHSYLQKGTPVVVSVKGEIAGAPLPYKFGHLMVVIGYNPETNSVICLDSAWDADEKTYVEYDLEEFLKAWNTRRNLAYTFEKVTF